MQAEGELRGCATFSPVKAVQYRTAAIRDVPSELRFLASGLRLHPL
jgi:hypothetical protein